MMNTFQFIGLVGGAGAPKDTKITKENNQREGNLFVQIRSADRAM
jgi:hypothetical protein